MTKWICKSCGAVNPNGSNECHACFMPSPDYGVYNYSFNWSDKNLIKEGLENLKNKHHNTVKDRIILLISRLED